MQTMERLTKAYQHARVEEFDDDSRYVFLSDVHRGDGSMADEFAKNKNIYVSALEWYDAEKYTYVEVGDGDELWENADFKHILWANGSPYSRLKRFYDDGRLIYLYGNHNMQLKDPDFARACFDTIPDDLGQPAPFMPDLHPCEALVLRHRETGQDILVVHGHQGDFPNDQNWHFTMWTFRVFWKYMHAFGIRSPSSPVRNMFKRHKVERNYRRWILENQTALICGHTHRQKFPRDGVPYFNTGCCTFPSYITGIEIVGGQIQLVGWRVEPDADRFLRVVRRVLAGPEPIENYASHELGEPYRPGPRW